MFRDPQRRYSFCWLVGRGGAVDGPMVTQRSAGSFVGELDFVEPAAADTKYWWQTEAVARTPVAALQLNQADLLKLYEHRPLAQVGWVLFFAESQI